MNSFSKPRYFHFLGEALEAVPEEQRRLGLMIFLALLGHVAAFFFLRVASPSTIVIAAPRTRVTLYAPLPDGTEPPRYATFASWSGLNDPSTAIFPPGLAASVSPAPAPDAEVAPLWPQSPSSETTTIALSSAYEFLPDRLAPLPERAAAALAPPRQTFSYAFALSRPASARTTVQWAGGFADRHPPDWNLPAAPGNLLAESGVTVLRLAVDATGRVVHALVDAGSGNSEVDALALEDARLLRFPAAPGVPLLWGRATVFWQFQNGGGGGTPH